MTQNPELEVAHGVPLPPPRHRGYGRARHFRRLWAVLNPGDSFVLTESRDLAGFRKLAQACRWGYATRREEGNDGKQQWRVWKEYSNDCEAEEVAPGEETGRYVGPVCSDPNGRRGVEVRGIGFVEL